MPEYITRIEGGKLIRGIVTCEKCGGFDSIVTYCRAFAGLEEIERRCICGHLIRMERTSHDEPVQGLRSEGAGVPWDLQSLSAVGEAGAGNEGAGAWAPDD